jgi:hypothetical protein
LTVAVQAIKLSEACDHYLWNFKREVTQKARFLEQATKICAGDIDKLRVCEARRYIYRQNRVFRIRIGFNADPDPAFYLNYADPDSGSRTNADPDPQYQVLRKFVLLRASSSNVIDAVRSQLDLLLDPGNVVDPDPDPVDPKLSGLLYPDPDIDPSYLLRFEELSENKFNIL